MYYAVRIRKNKPAVKYELVVFANDDQMALGAVTTLNNTTVNQDGDTMLRPISFLSSAA
jgi:hypothetical protein